MNKHFISLNDFSAEEFSDLLAVAAYLKQRRAQGIPEQALAGKTLAMIFEKPSLRTRMSFEMAMTELGGRSMFVRGEEVGIDTREPARDVARVLSRYVQGIMARVFKHKTIIDLAEYGSVPVINGLSDFWKYYIGITSFLIKKVIRASVVFSCYLEFGIWIKVFVL